MSVYKSLARNYTVWILTCTILALFAQVSLSYSAGRLVTWPSDEGIAQSKSNGSFNAHEVRKGKIILAPEILPKPAGAADHRAAIVPSKGDDDTISVNLFADVSYDVIVDSVKHHTDGTTIVNGKLKDHKIGTVVMTIGPEGFLMTVQDMKKGLLYRVTGDSRQGSGSVTEIDMKKMPPMVR